MWSRRRALVNIARGARQLSSGSRFTPAKTLNGDTAEGGEFELTEPTVLPKYFTDIPAIKKWFESIDWPPTEKSQYQPNVSYLGRHGSLMVPLELRRDQPRESEGATTEMNKPVFERIQAPLSLLLSHMESEDHSHQLYLAQHSLSDLPTELQDDLPIPDFISEADIYGSSLWIGRAPTSTPLHRDPNPNLFIQLVGTKVIRLMRPKLGRQLYETLRTNKGHAHMRGEEMMIGEERDRLQRAVWDEHEFNGVSASGVEARLDSGDGLFIPLGWWHAINGIGTHANASVNWWFRD